MKQDVSKANGFEIGKTESFKASPSTNETSILCILFWPSTGNSAARCSYFTGGDGHPKVEREAVVPFLKDVLKIPQVTVLKLDHHGSSGELLGTGQDRITEDIVTLMAPSRVIVTPGDGYGHPSKYLILHKLDANSIQGWDVVAFLYDYHRKSILAEKREFEELLLYTTRTPY